MYEFDEQRWDRQQADASNETDRVAGWLIQKIAILALTRFVDSQRIYLQIATGQWCTSKFATLFPTKSAAIAYARRNGYSDGQTAQIVQCPRWHRCRTVE